MRETLSLLRLYHWTSPIQDYWRLIKWWGWKAIITDTWWDFRRITGPNLEFHYKPTTTNICGRGKRCPNHTDGFKGEK